MRRAAQQQGSHFPSRISTVGSRGLGNGGRACQSWSSGRTGRLPKRRSDLPVWEERRESKCSKNCTGAAPRTTVMLSADRVCVITGDGID